MSVLLVGVGGVGRGVCNWLKERIEHEYGNPASAGFAFLVIDGPGEQENQYKLPDGYQIDVSPQSTEFYQLTQLPGPAIVAVQNGQQYPFVDQWLGRAEALKISNPGAIIPETGYGQTRPAARVGFFLEASDLAPRLTSAVVNQNYIILVGSQSGGTGSGMLLDIAQIIRDKKPVNAVFHAYIALPKGFSNILTDDQDMGKGNARGFAGMRELERLRMRPGHVDYCTGTSVGNSELFDGCFIIDGEVGGGFSLNSVPPVFGLCPALADHILTVYSTGIAAANAATWRANSTIDVGDGKPREPGYWVPGAYTYLYDWKALETGFAYRFAQELYDALLALPPDHASKGRQLAAEALRSTGPGALSFQLDNDKALSIPWPQLGSTDSLQGLTTLRDNLTTRGPSSSAGPKPPYANVLDWVDVSRPFSPVANDALIHQCHGFSQEYIGQPTDEPHSGHDATLWGWINYQRGVICREFIQQLSHQLLSLFYDVDQDGWRTLNAEPYCLIVARDALDECRKLLAQEQDEITKWLNLFTHNKVLENAEQTLDAAEDDLRQQRNSRANQEAFVEGPYQWYHTLLEWHTLLQGYEDTIRDMLALTDDLWMKIGQTADGWIGYLHQCRDEMQKSYNSDVTNRQEYARAQSRRHLPDPGGAAEAQLYDEVVRRSGLIGAMLSQMHWEFDSKYRQGGGLAFGSTVGADEIAASFDCYLVCPAVDGHDLPDQKLTYLADGVSGSYRKTIIARHEPGVFVQEGRNKTAGPLAQKDIWDIAALEAAVAGQTQEQYAKVMAADLMAKSGAALSLAGAAEPTEEFYEASVHTESPVGRDVLRALSEAGCRAAGAAAGSPFRYSVTLVRIVHRVLLPDWSHYDQTRGGYYIWRGRIPCHCYTEERHATDYVEEFLLRNNRAQVGELPLHQSVCRHLRDWKAFESLCVCFALLGAEGLHGVTNPLRDTGGGVQTRRYYVPDCQTSGPSADCDLGLACDLDGVLTTLMTDRGLANLARAKLTGFCRDGLPTLVANDDQLRAVVEAALKPDQPADIALPPPDTSGDNPEGLHRAHFQMACWAACWQYCANVLGI